MILLPLKDVAMMPTFKLALLIALLLDGNISALATDDWPMLGRDGTRNAVSPEKNPPTFWQIKGVPTKFDEEGRGIEEAVESKNIKWMAELGHLTLGDPVISGGLVWVGTNNRPGPGEANVFVLKCFRESDGKLLYQHVTPRPLKGWGHEWSRGSFSCSPLAEGDRIWFVTNLCETVCLDVGPLRRGEGEPRTLWRVDMADTLGVFRRSASMAWNRTSSVAAYGGRIYVITGNGVDDTYQHVPAPQAPSLVCFEKETGRVVWQDNSPSANILYGQWASPLVIEIDGQPQCLAPQGDGWLRSFDPATGRLLWEFDLNPKTAEWKPGGVSDRNIVLATPVFYGNRIYIAVGKDYESGEGPGRLWCIDPTRRLDGGDVSLTLGVDSDGNRLPRRRLQAVDLALGEREIPNPDSAVVWQYSEQDQNGDGKIDFEETMHRTMASVAIDDGLLIAADISGLVHCLDAQSGKVHWTHDLLATISASPLIVDGKAYLTDQDGNVTIFALSKEKRLIAKHFHGDSVYCAPVLANGTLYVATKQTLLAIASEESVPDVAATGGHWPQWRGPNRDNVSTETGLLKEWPEGGPPLVWRAEGIGEGIASVAVAGGRLFTISRQENQEYIVALDEGSGRHLWSAYLGRTIPQFPPMQWLTQRAPTVENDHLYAVSGLGDLVCLRTDNGQELWRKSYEEDLQGQRGFFGYGDRPLVDGDRLIIMPGGITASVTALNSGTGEVLWTCAIPDEKHRSGGDYGAGVIADIHGVRQFVVSLTRCSVGIAVDDGRLLWRYEGKGNPTLHSTLTPFVRDRHVVIPMGYGQQLLLLEIVAVDDDYAAQEVYAVRTRFDPFQDNTCLVGEHLYAFGNIAGCYHWKTGEKVWQSRITRSRAAGTYADGQAYVRDSAGEVKLLRASPEGLVEKGKFSLPEAESASGATLPVIAGGRFYLRDDTRLFCYDIRADAFVRSRPSVKTISLPALGSGLRPPAARPRTGVNRAPDAVFVPTPQDVVEQMLKLASIQKQDVVYDLGSGDGRIVITAAKTYGVQAVGVEIDPELIKLSQQRVEENHLADLVTIRHEDMFQVDLSQADVVAVFLYPRLLERLRPQFAKMKPGSRIVSHQFLMPDVDPDQVLTLESAETGDRHTLYLWITPLKLAPPKPK